MSTILEIVDAVRQLNLKERRELFSHLRELGLEPEISPLAPDFSRCSSEEFAQELTEHFHRAKLRALEAE